MMVNMRMDTPPLGLSPGTAADDGGGLIQRQLTDGKSDDPTALPELAIPEMDNIHRLAACKLSNSANVVSPRNGMEQEKRVRREIANSNERRRMQSINQGFQSLRSLLPRRDGEKMSKAAILQQTADFISNLQLENQQLAQQNCQYKKLLDEQSVVDTSQQDAASQVSPVHRTTVLAPPKKRRRFMVVNEEPSENLSSSPGGAASPAPLSPKLATTCDEACGKQRDQSLTWDADLIQNQVLEMRLALDRERRLRLVLEDQLRAIELTRIQSLGRLPSLLDYQHLSVSSASGQSGYQNGPGQLAFLGPPDELIAPAVVNSFSTLHSSSSPFATVASQGVAKFSADSQQQAFAAPPSPTKYGCGSTHAASAGLSSSRQNLEVIVEAIRHLEGDRLLLDLDSGSTNRRTVAPTEHRCSDSGISSPVSDPTYPTAAAFNNSTTTFSFNSS